jgi:hypothetical protein
MIPADQQAYLYSHKGGGVQSERLDLLMFLFQQASQWMRHIFCLFN